MTQPPTPLQSYLPGSHDIMYLLTCKHAVSRFATARVGSPNRPDFAGHKNRGGARWSHFCGSAQALRSDIDRSFQPRANLRRWPTPGAAWPMKKRVSPGAGRAIILIHARSISRLETAFGRCDLCRLASSVRDLGRQHLRELEGRIRRRGLSNFLAGEKTGTAVGRFHLRALTPNKSRLLSLNWRSKMLPEAVSIRTAASSS